MAFLLGCEKVRVEFPTKTVFDNVSLGIDEGDRIGIVGRNGDGKSTLLSLLSGALEPDEGRVVRNGSVRVGLLGQTDGLHDSDTVKRSLVGDAPEYEWAGDARIRDILDGLVSDIPWEAEIGTLSGGQRRRVDLARLLIGDWDMLGLDEPTNHLDIKYQLQLMELVRVLGRTVVAAIHDLNLAALYCQRLYVMKAGRVAASGTPEEVLTPELLREIYEVEAEVARDSRGCLRIFFQPIRNEGEESI